MEPPSKYFCSICDVSFPHPSKLIRHCGTKRHRVLSEFLPDLREGRSDAASNTPHRQWSTSPAIRFPTGILLYWLFLLAYIQSLYCLLKQLELSASDYQSESSDDEEFGSVPSDTDENSALTEGVVSYSLNINFTILYNTELLALLDASDELENYSPFSTKAAALLYLMANSRHPIVCVLTQPYLCIIIAACSTSSNTTRIYKLFFL